jgi:hypothetical protein
MHAQPSIDFVRETTTLGLVACCLSLMLSACGSSPRVADGAQDGIDAVNEKVEDIAIDMPSSEGVATDTSSDELADAIDWDAALECGGMRCAASELCVRWRGGLDASPDLFHCNSVPDCGANPTCDCLRNFVVPCSTFQCRPEGPRRFACGEGV